MFVSFTSEIGYALLEGRLYPPPVWFGPEYEARRKACSGFRDELARMGRIYLAAGLPPLRPLPHSPFCARSWLPSAAAAHVSLYY